MEYVPDITERPWYTAAQKYRDSNAPEFEDTNIYICISKNNNDDEDEENEEY